MFRNFYLFFILILMALPANGQTNRSASIKQIGAFSKAVNDFIKQNKRNNQSQIVVAETSDYGSPKPTWRRFASMKSLEKYRETHEVYNSANSWRRNNRTILSVITLSSPSGDWAKYLYLYYRQDGTLAKAESDLLTYRGDFVARQKFYFDPGGKLVKKSVAFFDLNSEKPKKPASSYLSDNAPFLNENNYYKTTAMLPFSELLGKK